MNGLDFRIIALPTAVAESVRATMRDPHYRYPAVEELATGAGPCRHCLRAFTPGVDRRILFNFDPFAGIEALPLPGPVFIHSRACERYPEGAGFPSERRARALTFNAYGRGRRLLAQAYVDDGDVEPTIGRLFANPDVAYIHLRDTQAGCYDFRIERP